jgi:mono/diheme cytochrome c family protein
MRRNWHVIVVFVAALALLAACGGGGGAPAGGAAPAGGDAGAGQALFAQTVIGSQPGCATCHSLNAGEKLVGPSLAGVGTRAASTVSGQSAEQYLRTSIVNPHEHVVTGFADGIMLEYKDGLSEQQVNDLLAYLLTLK